MKRLIYSAGVMTLLLWNGELAAADTRFPPSEYQIRWSRIANYPIRLSELSAIAIGDRIHVVGGKITNDTRDLADNRDVGAHYEYDPAANTWIRRADMPTPRYDVALTALHGRIHAISSANESYDRATDSWQQHAPLPHGGAHQSLALPNLEERAHFRTRLTRADPAPGSQRPPTPPAGIAAVFWFSIPPGI